MNQNSAKLDIGQRTFDTEVALLASEMSVENNAFKFSESSKRLIAGLTQWRQLKLNQNLVANKHFNKIASKGGTLNVQEYFANQSRKSLVKARAKRKAQENQGELTTE